MANQVIDVRVNPNEQPDNTGVQQTQTPLVQAPKRTGVSLQNAATLAFAVQAGKQLFSAAVNNIGNVTGRSDIQRQVNNALQNGRISAQVIGGSIALLSNPLTGVAALGALGIEMGINSFEQSVSIRNENIEADFYNQMRGNRINRSRS